MGGQAGLTGCDRYRNKRNFASASLEPITKRGSLEVYGTLGLRCKSL